MREDSELSTDGSLHTRAILGSVMQTSQRFKEIWPYNRRQVYQSNWFDACNFFGQLLESLVYFLFQNS